jgi:hypothetical protein
VFHTWRSEVDISAMILELTRSCHSSSNASNGKLELGLRVDCSLIELRLILCLSQFETCLRST